MTEVWRQPDELIEKVDEARDPMQALFLQTVRESSKEETVEILLPKVELELPPRKGEESRRVLSPPYLKAIHVLIERNIPLRKIQKKYHISQVALRLHRDQMCLCRERGIVD